jgi:mRNA interferase MazF
MTFSIYQFGDVVLVPFPFTDQSSSKKRPAVVISSSAYHTQRADLIIMAITSQAHTVDDFAVCVLSGWKAAGLLKPSLAKPIVSTLEQSLVIRQMGRLTEHDQHAVRQVLTQMLG